MSDAIKRIIQQHYGGAQTPGAQKYINHMLQVTPAKDTATRRMLSLMALSG